MNPSDMLNSLISLRENFHLMSETHQILIFVGLIALTVLTLSLVYYLVKGVLYLTFYIVKGSLYLAYYSVKLPLQIVFYTLKGITQLVFMPFTYHRPHNHRRIRAHVIVRASYPEIKTKTPGEETIKINHFCPTCGKPFTSVMENLFVTSDRCFCESCGAKAEITA
ncbi:MAG: hypothetical protein ACTSRK_06465 [Promethearchaeota archaeon]